MSLRRLIRFSVFAIFAPLAALAIGCTVKSETEPQPGPTFKYPTEASFCEAIAQAECSSALVDACYGGSDDATNATNTDSCVAIRSASEVCRSLPGYAGADLGGVRYNPEVAVACVESRRQIFADAELRRQELEDNEVACRGVFSKARAAGASCEADVDCDTLNGLSCIVKAGEIDGACGEPAIVGGGLDCTGDDAVCADGFYCDGDSGACLGVATAGKDCGASKPCDEGLSCAGPSDGAVCVEKLADGSDCKVDDECAGTFCDKPISTDDGVCSSSLELNKFAASCDAFRP
jgi:hypothetical protein